MKSFKKISLVIAAALTSTMIIATSSNAAALTVTVANGANVTTSVAPQLVTVPSTNVIDSAHSVAITATADTGTTVSFTTTGIRLVSALNTVEAPKTVASGVSSVSFVSTGASITVYAYTTSVNTGSVSVNNGAYSTIVYVKGIAGDASKISLSVPTAVAVGTIPTISASVTDAFGNPVGGELVSLTLIGSTFVGGSPTSAITTSSVNSAVGVSPVTVIGTGSATLATAVAGEITVVATGAAFASTVIGIDAPVKSAIAKFTVSDLNAQITALKAEIALANLALVAEKAGRASDKVSSDKALADAKTVSDGATATNKAEFDLKLSAVKAQFNALAKKWNKKNPASKVALLK